MEGKVTPSNRGTFYPEIEGMCFWITVPVWIVILVLKSGRVFTASPIQASGHFSGYITQVQSLCFMNLEFDNMDCNSTNRFCFEREAHEHQSWLFPPGFYCPLNSLSQFQNFPGKNFGKNFYKPCPTADDVVSLLFLCTQMNCCTNFPNVSCWSSFPGHFPLQPFLHPSIEQYGPEESGSDSGWGGGGHGSPEPVWSVG